MTKRRTYYTCGYVINPSHPFYGVRCALHIHYRTNAGYMVRYCGQWSTVSDADFYPMEA